MLFLWTQAGISNAMKTWQLRYRKPRWCLTAANSNDHKLSSFKQQNYPLSVLKPKCGGRGSQQDHVMAPTLSTSCLFQLLTISPCGLWHETIPCTHPFILPQDSASEFSAGCLRTQAQILGPALSEALEADLTTSWMSRIPQTKVRSERAVSSYGMD